MLETLREWVNFETPTGDEARLNAFSRHVEAAFAAAGAHVNRVPLAGGDLLSAQLGEGRRRLLLLGHMDTVFPLGKAERFDRENGRLYGAGVADMKAGLVMLAHLLRALSTELPADWQVLALVNADEESGSRASRPVIERLAAGAEACLCFEPSAPGECTIERKGIVSFRVDVKGTAAHASGGDPGRKSAVRALAALTNQLYALEADDLRVNIGVISGGERANVVAARASLTGEARAFSSDALEAFLRQARGLAERMDTVRASLTVLSTRPPMPRAAGSERLLALAQTCAVREGCALRERARGGGSDGSLVAALGVPVLDGMGAEGARTHTRREYVVEATLLLRFRLALETARAILRAPRAGKDG